MGIKSTIRNAFSCIGLDVRLKQNLVRNRQLEHLEKWRQQWASITNFQIGTILDIGANQGQFAEMIRGVFPHARIISFEPLPSCIHTLEKVISNIGNAECHNIGLGDTNASCKMFLSSSSPSSSLLGMADKHKEEWPLSADNTPEQVTIKRLDDAVDINQLQESIAIKIDVQGFEDKVIAGGPVLFGKAKVVVIETSFVALYNEQPLFADIYEQMRCIGFEYRGALDTTRSKINNEIIQEDSCFINLNS